MTSPVLSFLVFSLTLVVSLCDDAFTCVAGTGISGGVKMPTVMKESNSYQARVEVNILDKDFSFVVDEYLDFTGNRARLDIFKAGNKESVIYSFPTDEVFDVKSQNCQVYTLDNDPYKDLFGSAVAVTPSDPDKRHAFGSAAALRFAGNSSDLFKGNSTVRGIPADVWTSCIDYPGAFGKVKASYYFSPPGWSTSSPEFQMPLRIEVEGLTETGPGGEFTPSKFHHIYDYINYLPFVIGEPTLFETPPDVICKGRKNTEDIPLISPYFRYRMEEVNPETSNVIHYSIWYDEDSNVYRAESSVADTLTPGDSLHDTGNLYTEIHDFNTGLRFVKGPEGTCTITPMQTTEQDIQDKTSSGQFAGSYVLDMKGPNNFFRTNVNYTFIGKRTVRGISCDVFSNVIPGYVVEGETFNATFEYAFLSSDWTQITGIEESVSTYPVQLVVNVPENYYKRIFNYFDYVEEHAVFRHFDVTSCFDDSQKIGFCLTFPGTFIAGTEETWITEAHSALHNKMEIVPLRVGGITVTHDVDVVYVSGYVLGTSYLARFEKATTSLSEYADDKVVKGITVPDDCAYLCLTTTDFTCDGFQYCPDDGYACRLSKTRGATNSKLANATSCDDFTRTVDSPSWKMILVTDAFSKLDTAVREGSLLVTVDRPDKNGFSDNFVATDIETISELPVASKRMPWMPAGFFFRLETVLPETQTVQDTFVWYNEEIGLVRYDHKVSTSETPFMITRIHDFLNGVAFNINQVTEECTVTSIPTQAVFDVGRSDFYKDVNGSFYLTMNTPQGMFFFDDSYKYVGQETTRGILCDVYESWRTDFDLEYYNISNANTVFKYYFQTDLWDYYSMDDTKTTQHQPVQLKIEDRTRHTSMTYNYYDITEREYVGKVFDPTVCYGADQRLNILIVFGNQQYHPILDRLSNKFIEEANVQLATATQLSLIRFQKTSIAFDYDNVYVTATILGNVSPLAYFIPVLKVKGNLAASQNSITAESAEDCAASCDVATTSADKPGVPFICESFDFCPNTDGPNCLLGASHTESEGDTISNSGTCTHYSRSENNVLPTISVKDMYEKIVDAVYNDKFVVSVMYSNHTFYSFKATDIRDDILVPSDSDSSIGSAVKQFDVTRGYRLNGSKISITHDGSSITDCAESCLQENTFDCEAFDYQFNIGRCRLSAIHPDEESSGTSVFTKDSSTNVYAKLYTKDYYLYPGQMSETKADKVVQGVQGDEMCAKACTDNVDFLCESFEICNDGSCLLRKTHVLASASGNSTQSADCTHYSRNHLFDYIERKQQVINGHDDSTVDVKDNTECAYLCASGDGLPSCASFEVCEKERGEISCILSTADPTVQRDLKIENSMQCSLFTKANQSPVINPATSGPTSPPGKNTVVTKAVTTRKPTTRATQKPFVTNKPTPGTGSNTAPQACTALPQASSPSDLDDTGARVGIAFATLILGLIVGIVSSFFIMRWHYGRQNNEDQNMLQSFSN